MCDGNGSEERMVISKDAHMAGHAIFGCIMVWHNAFTEKNND